MSMYYSDNRRLSDPYALPDIEVFYINAGLEVISGRIRRKSGWYWWTCFPGCLPDGDPIGPFKTEEAALIDARIDLLPEEKEE